MPTLVFMQWSIRLHSSGPIEQHVNIGLIQIFEKMKSRSRNATNYCQNALSFSGFRPLNAMTRGSAPGPRWEPGLETPISRHAFSFPASGSASV